MELFESIKEARLKKGLNQREMAHYLNIDPSQYSKIERGGLNPTLNQVLEIAEYCELSLDELVYGIKKSVELDSVMDYSSEYSNSQVDYKVKYLAAQETIKLLRENHELKDEILNNLREKLTILQNEIKTTGQRSIRS